MWQVCSRKEGNDAHVFAVELRIMIPQNLLAEDVAAPQRNGSVTTERSTETPLRLLHQSRKFVPTTTNNKIGGTYVHVFKSDQQANQPQSVVAAATAFVSQPLLALMVRVHARGRTPSLLIVFQCSERAWSHAACANICAHHYLMTYSASCSATSWFDSPPSVAARMT